MSKTNKFHIVAEKLAVLMACMLPLMPVQAQQVASLSLSTALQQAVQQDDWQQVSTEREAALREAAVSAGELPDPRLMLSLMNVPVESFSFDQEPMTQFKLGVSQSFPKGDTRELSQRQKLQQSEVNPPLRAERAAMVRLTVTRLWLDAWLAQQSIALIETDRNLFEQLLDITDARYRTAAGVARQQDLVRAELELSRLDDRLAMLRQALENNRQQLAQWLPYELLSLPLTTELPAASVPATQVRNLSEAAEVFARHPSVQAIERRIKVSETAVELARQGYKPGYSVGASYAYRDNGPGGIQRDDFVSLDISFDLPLFTEKRQQPKVAAAAHETAALRSERLLQFKSLFAAWQQASAQARVLQERKQLYEDSLLQQMHVLTEATLSSYTSDEGDFAEVTRAYIAELNARIELLGIDVERRKMLARLDYLLTADTD